MRKNKIRRIVRRVMYMLILINILFLFINMLFLFKIVFIVLILNIFGYLYFNIQDIRLIKNTEQELNRIGYSGNGEITQFIKNYIEKETLKSSEIEAHYKSLHEDQVKQTESIKESIYNVALVIGKIRNIREEILGLSSSIEQSSSATIEISRTTENFIKLIENQSAAVEETSASVEESTASLKNIQTNTTTSMEKSKKLFSISKESEDHMHSTNKLINDIAEKITSINTVITIINGVAAQTNLLAMNAAIEAAHAGTYGRGFAVVADEIRKLAESSSKNSKQITKDLKGIITDIDIVKGSGEKSFNNFTLVTSEIENLINSLTEINYATEEILKGSLEIVGAVTDLNSVSTSIDSGSKEMSQSLNEIQTAIEEIREMGQRSANHTADLEEAAGNINNVFLEFTNSNILIGQNSDSVKSLVLRNLDSGLPVNLQIIIQQHLLWLIKIRAVIDGKLTIDLKEVGDHTSCDLGKAMESTENEEWKLKPFYSEMDVAHEGIHNLIIEILSNNDRWDSQKLEQKFAETISISEKIIEYLNMLDE